MKLKGPCFELTLDFSRNYNFFFFPLWDKPLKFKTETLWNMICLNRSHYIVKYI